MLRTTLRDAVIIAVVFVAVYAVCYLIFMSARETCPEVPPEGTQCIQLD